MKASLLVLVLALTGCATYRDDLDRAANHYRQNEPEHAIALLEVLEKDIDSLSAAERAQYAYYRGMSHFRLGQKLDARHWLGVAAAREKKDQGSLAPDEKQRVGDTLGELNEIYYGGGSKMGEETTCKSDGDCAKGQFCDAGKCADSPLEGDEGKSDEPKKEDDGKGE